MKLLVVVNNTSGSKNANFVLENNLINKLDNNPYLLSICQTIEEVESSLEDLSMFQGILILGGDGTVFKVVQSILNSKIDIPIGHVPCGSGNGLSKSLLFSKNMDLTINNSIESILKFETKKIDTMQIKLLKSNRIINSFLFVSVGTFSNIDIKTEWLRILGNFRFTLGGLWEMVWKNSFYAKLEYKKENDIVILRDNFIYFLAGNLSHTSDDTHTSPGAKIDDGKIKIAFITSNNCSRYQLYKILMGLEDGSYVNHLTYIETNYFKLTPIDGCLDIDGESFSLEPIEVEIKSKSMKVYY